jgi:MFS family permease
LAAHALDLHFFARQAAYLLSMTAAAAVAGKLLTGFLSDHVGDRQIYWSSAAVLVAAMISLIAFSSYEALMAAALLSGLASGSIQPLLSTTLVRRFGAANFGKAIGLAQLPMSLTALGPQIAGRVYDRTGSYSGAFGAFAVAIVLSMLLMTAAGRKGNTGGATSPATTPRRVCASSHAGVIRNRRDGKLE